MFHFTDPVFQNSNHVRMTYSENENLENATKQILSNRIEKLEK